MLFLSQVLGEEEDAERREQLVDVLTRAVVFTGQAQTAGRRLGLRQRQGRQRFRRRLDHDHPGAGAARLPQRRHPRAQGDHRQGGQLHPANAPARRRRAVQLQGRRRPAGHHRRGHRLPVQRRRVRQRVRAQAAELLQEATSTTSPTRASATGTTPTTTTPRCCIAKAARPGRSIATRSFRGSSPRPAADGSWNQGYIGPVYTTADQPDHPATGQRRRCRFINVEARTRCHDAAPTSTSPCTIDATIRTPTIEEHSMSDRRI